MEMDFGKVKKWSLYSLKLLLEGIALGIITGLIVSYLFATPTISMTGTVVKKSDNHDQVGIAFENKGKSKAKNVLLNLLFGYEGADPSTFRRVQPKFVETVDSGDVFSFTIKEFPKSLNDRNVILLLFLKYEDPNKVRQCVNQTLLGNDYKILKWMKHSMEKNTLSADTSQGKEVYKTELFKRMKKIS